MAEANSTGNADSNGDIKNSREFRSNNQMASTVGIGNSAVSAVVVATCDSKILSIQFRDGAILCRDCQQTGLPGYSIFNSGSHWTACWA